MIYTPRKDCSVGKFHLFRDARNPPDLALSRWHSIPWRDYAQLPTYPAIYIVLDPPADLLYIGKAETGIPKRWKSGHHNIFLFERHPDARLTYLFGETKQTVWQMEDSLLRRYQARYNFWYPAEREWPLRTPRPWRMPRSWR